MEEPIKLLLTKDESIVLFEILSRFGENDTLTIEDQSESKVLWNIHCNLEKILVEPFQENYVEKLIEARSNVRDKE